MDIKKNNPQEQLLKNIFIFYLWALHLSRDLEFFVITDLVQ